jgi:hypothetical protein
MSAVAAEAPGRRTAPANEPDTTETRVRAKAQGMARQRAAGARPAGLVAEPQAATRGDSQPAGLPPTRPGDRTRRYVHHDPNRTGIRAPLCRGEPASGTPTQSRQR